MKKFGVIAKAIKEYIKNIYKTYSEQHSQAFLNSACLFKNGGLNKDVTNLATHTPFSYSDIFPLYEQLGKDKEKTLKAINFGVANNLPLYIVRCLVN